MFTNPKKTVIRNTLICVLVLLLVGYVAYSYWEDHIPTVPEELRGIYTGEMGDSIELTERRIDCTFFRNGEFWFYFSNGIDAISETVYDTGAKDFWGDPVSQVTVVFLSPTTVEVYLNGALQSVMQKNK